MLKLNGTEGFDIQRYTDDWQQLIRDSEFQLCPRGKGPTSYRLYESLQAETIPIYIWWRVRPHSLPVNPAVLKATIPST